MNEMPQKSKLAPEVVIERDIAYPPEQVFAAWTSQDALRLWMGPGKVSAPRRHDGCASGRSLRLPHAPSRWRGHDRARRGHGDRAEPQALLHLVMG